MFDVKPVKLTTCECIIYGVLIFAVTVVLGLASLVLIPA
jgi:hypothetical protein